MTTGNKPFLRLNINGNIDWDRWLSDLDKYMLKSGYKQYNQNLKGENFAYWKTFEDSYQVGLYIFDFREFENHINIVSKVSFSFECSFNDCRIELTVVEKIDLHEFEEMAKVFYDSMEKYCPEYKKYNHE